jgi:predicted nucleic acid-binding protein
VIVLDASAVVEWLLQSPPGLRIESRVRRPGESLHAPHLLDLEVAQVLRRMSREGRVSPARATGAIQDFHDLAITRYPHAPFIDRIWRLRHNLTAYGAAYILLAEALRAPLLTLDARLAAAAGHTALVEVF